jgi:hypothetical protein
MSINAGKPSRMLGTPAFRIYGASKVAIRNFARHGL